MKKSATKINIHIQNKVVLQHMGLRDFYQQGRWRDLWVHHTHLQNPLDGGYSKTLTQEGRDITVLTIDLQLLAATNNLLGKGVLLLLL